MTRFYRFVSRLLQGLLTIGAIAVFNFFLIRTAPGDPALIIAGEAGATDPAFLAQLRAEFGLDRPLMEQLWIYFQHLIQLDLGISYRQHEKVLVLILDRLPATLLLTGSAFVLSLLGGILIGAWASRRPHGLVDRLVSGAGLLLYATPLYWLALMTVLIFNVWLQWLPGFGFRTIGADLHGLALVFDVAQHLILPTLTLAFLHMAIYARMTRASMLEVAGADFVRTARAKGVSDQRIQYVHVLRNALLPIITLAGIQAGGLVGGAILTETVFAWPGIGRLMFEALIQRDYNLLLGCFLFTATMTVIFNFVADILYSMVDPRVEIK